MKDKEVSADTAYYSVENFEACKEKGVDAYVPDPQLRKRDIRFADAARPTLRLEVIASSTLTSTKNGLDIGVHLSHCVPGA